MLSSFIYQNCLLRVVAVGQSDSPELSHPPAVGKLPTPSIDAHAPVGNVDSHVRWKLFLLCLIFEVNHFIRQKQAFISTRKFLGGMVPWVRENSEVNPKLISGPMKQKSCPRNGIPDPSRTKHAARHRCWMKIGVCVICHMELRFGLHSTGSRKFYST